MVLVDHDRVRGAAVGPPVVGERQVVGFCRFGQVLVTRPRVRDRGRAGLAAGSGSGRCLAGGGHWPASRPAEGWGWLSGSGCRPAAAWEGSAATSIWSAIRV